MQNATSSGRITVTYSSSPAILSSPLTNHFIASLSHQLPLRTLHWRPSQYTLDATHTRAAKSYGISQPSSGPGSVIRTIQTLQVALKPLTDEIKRWRGDPGYLEASGAGGLLDRPFVHLYLVVCDDNDRYRTIVRNELRSWISSLSFFHSKPSGAAGPSTPSTSGPSRNSFGLGSFRSSTPPFRPDTLAANSPSGTPASSAATPSVKPGPASTFPSEPEYIIVVINPPEGSGVAGAPGVSLGGGSDAKTGMGRFYSKTKGSVIEKIKSDFNTSKKEHVVHLTRLPAVPATPNIPTPYTIDPTIWAELLTKMKESASTTFNSTIEAQEEEIKKYETARGQPGWDFCSYFLAKDALARTLEGVGLREDAVGQYDDLETVFLYAMQSGAVSFAPIGGDAPDDDSLPLLDVDKKPYQELIRRKEISLFDFRCYLFARRAGLLGKLGRVLQVMREAPTFIGAVARMLEKNPKITRRRIQSWIFSTSLDVVEQCQAWLIERGDTQANSVVEDQLSPIFHSSKAELLDLARKQLDKIGIQVGHLPNTEPFNLSGLESSADVMGRDLPLLPNRKANPEAVRDSQNATEPSRLELKQAIESQHHFDSHYISLTSRILAGWQSGGRKRSVLRIQIVLASLDFFRGRFEKAYSAFLTLTESYHEHGWDQVESHLLAKQLECHKQLEKPKDRAWISVVLAALKVAHQAKPSFLSSSTSKTDTFDLESIEKWQDVQFLFQELRQAASTFEKEIPVSGYPALSVIPLGNRAQLVEDEDGTEIPVLVLSSLPFELSVEDVRLCLLGEAGEVLWYTCGKTTLRPGQTRLDLCCCNPISGTYLLDVTQIRVSKLIFQYSPPPSSPSTATHRPTSGPGCPSLFVVPKDGDAMDVKIDLPKDIHLDRPREVEIQVYSGRNTVETAQISLTSTDGQQVIDYRNARIVLNADNTQAQLGKQPEATEPVSAVCIEGQKAVSTCCICAPLVVSSYDGALDLIVTIQYVSLQAEGQRLLARRCLKRRVKLLLSLPLGVNVQDYFRLSRLLSKFTVSAAGTGSIRLKPVRLTLESAVKEEDNEEEEEKEAVDKQSPYSIQGCGSQKHVTVTPRQPATYLFKVQKQSNAETPKTEGTEKLRLFLSYRTLREEAWAIVWSMLKDLIQEKNVERFAKGKPLCHLLEKALTAYIDAKLDLPTFSLSGEIKTGEFDKSWWVREEAIWGHVQSRDQIRQTLELVQTTLASVALNRSSRLAVDEVVQAKTTINPDEAIVNHQESLASWRLLSIPVEIPNISIVNAITLRIESDRDPTVDVTTTLTAATGYHRSAVIGQPITMTISVVTTFLWSAETTSNKTQMLVYDIIADFDNWLVSGTKRGTFSASIDPDSPFLSKVKLVPLKTGSLCLPTVLVKPIQTGTSCETYTTNAAQRIEIVPKRTTSSFWIDTCSFDQPSSSYQFQQTHLANHQFIS